MLIKMIMQTTRPSPHGRFYQWLRLPFLKKYSIKCEKILDRELFYSELKRHNVSIYLLSSHCGYDIPHQKLENDVNIRVNKRTLKGCKR